MLQAPMFDGLSLDPFTLFDDSAGPAEVGIGGRHIVQALVIALVIVMLDERLDLAFEVAGQEVVAEAKLSDNCRTKSSSTLGIKCGTKLVSALGRKRS